MRVNLQSKFSRKMLLAAFSGAAVVLGNSNRVDASYTLTVLGPFNQPTTGYNAESAPIIDSQGNLYGTNFYGGQNNGGDLYEIAASAPHLVSSVHAFGGNEGINPIAMISDAVGNFYGTTNSGGAGGGGTVYQVAAGTHVITPIVTFNGSNGAEAAALIKDSSGNMYGTTLAGGTSNKGTVFKIDAGTHAFSTVASFNGSNGSLINSVAVDGAGNIYGAANQGGANGFGTIFEILAGTHDITTLVTFNFANGEGPGGVISDAAGNLYGFTIQGGSGNDGTIFKIAAGTHTFTTVANFDATNGAFPLSALTFDSAGNVFGTAAYGGTTAGIYAPGTVFEIAAGTDAFNTIYNFTGGSDGSRPAGPVYVDANGNIFGTTSGDGEFTRGAVFELTPSVPEPLSGTFIGLSASLLLVRRRHRLRFTEKRGTE